MIEYIKAEIIKILILFGIMTVINTTWRLIEIVEFGKVTPSISDTIIGIILTFSLYANLNISIGGGEK